MKYFFIASIWIYHVILSPILRSIVGTKNVCRYTPSCSEYALERLQKDGIKSLPDITRRLLSCHPFGTIQK